MIIYVLSFLEEDCAAILSQSYAKSSISPYIPPSFSMRGSGRNMSCFQEFCKAKINNYRPIATILNFD